MSIVQIDDYARQLLRRARRPGRIRGGAEGQGLPPKRRPETAEQWRQVRENIRVLRGANVS